MPPQVAFLKYEGYLTLIQAKLIKHAAGNFIKTKNHLFKPDTENNGQKQKKVTA